MDKKRKKRLIKDINIVIGAMFIGFLMVLNMLMMGFFAIIIYKSDFNILALWFFVISAANVMLYSHAYLKEFDKLC